MEAYERYEQEIVRLFYDYTDSVVWFPDPVGYEEARLSEELANALRAWGRRNDEALAVNQEWPSHKVREAVEAELVELATRLGDELGSAFQVEYVASRRFRLLGGPSRRVRYRSSRPPTNPAAAAAFTARADAARAASAELAARHAELAEAASDRDIRLVGRDRSTGGWYAINPQTGERYDPGDRPR